MVMIKNGNRAEWSPIRSVIIRVINKMDDRKAGVRFVIRNHYNFRKKKRHLGQTSSQGTMSKQKIWKFSIFFF